MNFLRREDRIGRRASRIEDPVERLRYLRKMMQSAPEAGSVFERLQSVEFWKVRGSWVLLSLVGIALVTLRPGYTSHAAGNGRPARRESAVSAAIVRTPSESIRIDLATPNVWLVETHDGVENYSNGLRIDNKYAVSNEPRESYPVYGYGKSGLGIAEMKTEPAGIVYHTTESHLAPFEAGQNRRLVRIGSAVLEYVQSNRSYHFVVDRFGRVFRVVKESEIANHAGMSIWGDEKGAYVNLNASFLGIAFESATEAQGDAHTATPAQVHSGRVLTEMLRSKYGIEAGNCVTHEQVSVNPSNKLIGYHTDWAGCFPFAEMGLPDNYSAPPPSMFAFGFGYDDAYVRVTGNRVWQGLLMAEDQLQRQAASNGLPLSKYRASLQQRYREITAALKSKSPGKEKGDER